MFVVVCRLRNSVQGFFTSHAFAAARGPIRGRRPVAPTPGSRGTFRVRRFRSAKGASARIWHGGCSPSGAGMGMGERKTCVRFGWPAPYLNVRRPRVAAWVHRPGGGASLRRPVTAHLRDLAPRLSAPKLRKECKHALTGIRSMRYVSRLSGVGVHVGIFQGLRGLRWVRRSRGNAEGSREGLAREVRVGRDQASRFGMDRSHGDTEGVREGRRARTGSRCGSNPDHRAESLVRRCKGCSGVVFSHEVTGSR
jgi:hypothetical protein